MKYRKDFVTNSSSSSYIVCFARIANEEKASRIIDKHRINVMDASEVRGKQAFGAIGNEVFGAEIYGTDEVLEKYPNSNYVVIEDYCEADYSEDGEPLFRYDFGLQNAIDDITEKNGFADIQQSIGEGRDG